MKMPPPITSRTNARVKALRAAFSGDARNPGDLLGLEGTTLIVEAARSGLLFDTIFLREGSQSRVTDAALEGVKAREWVTLTEQAFTSAVDTASPQGIAATLVIPELDAFDFETPGVALVVESLQDPGNLGTLLRSAEAFGVGQIFVTQDTVNRWNPKAVRASAGSVFRVPVVRAPLASTKEFLRGHGYKLLAAVVDAANATPLMESDLHAPCALLIGNEGAGLSAAALALADKRIHIPCAVESLNAAIAGSTLMYEAMRQNARTAEGTA